MTRFSVTLDEELLEEAQALAQAKSKREAIELALQEFVRRRRVEELVGLVGSDIVDMDPAELRRWRRGVTPDS